MTQILMIPGLVVLVLCIVLVLASIVFKERKRDSATTTSSTPTPTAATNTSEKNKNKWSWSWVKHPAFFIAIGIVILNWLTWTLSRNFWFSLWNDQGRFWSMNIGLWLSLVLLLVKKEDGKDVHPIAKGISIAISIMLSIILISAINDYNKKGGVGDTGSSIKGKTVANLSHNVPMGIALPIIADCESGGGVFGAAHQFEADGITPLKNKEGSSAIGKYQILASHKDRAKKMGFDIETLEGNEGYARVLYQESGTKHWEVDSRSKACWEPKLASLGFDQGIRGRVVSGTLVQVEAPVGAFSKEIVVPLGFRVDWDESEDSFIIVNNRGLSAKYNKAEGILDDIPPPSQSIRFQSLGDKIATVKLRFKKI